jgi:hypothetical protein
VDVDALGFGVDPGFCEPPGLAVASFSFSFCFDNFVFSGEGRLLEGVPRAGVTAMESAIVKACPEGWRGRVADWVATGEGKRRRRVEGVNYEKEIGEKRGLRQEEFSCIEVRMVLQLNRGSATITPIPLAAHSPLQATSALWDALRRCMKPFRYMIEILSFKSNKLE